MKVFYKLLMVTPFLLCSIAVFAQNSEDTTKINFIKKQFIDINSRIGNYKKVTKEDVVETTEGNELTAYFNADEIKKINAVYYGETGKFISEYYFFDKKLIFYYSLEQRYKQPINNGKVTVASTTENRYYFDNGIILKQIVTPAKKLSANEISKINTDTQKEAKRLITLVSQNNKK